ncbi:hypothetical protein BASA81_015869 [Batrachochytrium salamandrivorans]|nr:hypothetical protein BASA81_015869 [Batrachochytrium salamandrivorans]
MVFKWIVVAAGCAWANSKSGTEKWFHHAVRGETELVLEMYAQNSDLLNQVDFETGRTALMVAANNNHTQLALALAQLPEVDVALYERSGSKESALDSAVKDGNFAIFAALADRVDLNEENESSGMRPIHVACSGSLPGHREILQSLLESHPVSAWDESKEGLVCMGYIMRAMRATQFRGPNKLTPEAYAFKREMVRLVLVHGASTTGLEDDEIALLQLTHKEVRAAQSRESHLGSDARVDQNIPVLRGAKWANSDLRLLEAIQRSNGKWAEIEVKFHGANIDVLQPSNKQTPFMTSALKGNVKMMAKLLELGADPNKGEENGYTAFHGAGFQGHADVARFLCRQVKQLDANEMHKDGYRPIHRACWGKEARFGEFVKVLIEECGVDPDSMTKQKQTPLQVLVSNKQYFNQYTARALIEGGADSNKIREEELVQLKVMSDDDFTTCRAVYQ